MLQLAGVTAEDVVYDLGSGDGRIPIIAAQKYGARGLGIEIDPRLVTQSWGNANDAQVANRVQFHGRRSVRRPTSAKRPSSRCICRQAS